MGSTGAYVGSPQRSRTLSWEQLLQSSMDHPFQISNPPMQDTAVLPTRDLSTPTGPLALTVIGFGGAPLGNMYAAISDADASMTLDAAWDEGLRVFDTAPQYGVGLSEERFGRAIATR